MVLWERLVSFGESIIDPVLSSFAPRHDATRPEIRKNGLVCLGFGALSFAIGAGLLLTLRRPGLVPALPLAIGYVLIGVGAYRALLGKASEPGDAGELSPLRVLIAACAIAAVFAGFFGLLRLARHLSGSP